MTRWETWRSARTLEPAHVGAVLLLLVLAGIVAIANRDSSYDDSYITFRYAANFAKGEGLVYNEGSEILGTTAPLYALVLGVLGLPNPDAIPAIGGAMSAVALAAVALALYALGRSAGHSLAGFVSGLLVVSHPLLHATFGGEMLVEAALVLWAIVLYRAQRDVAAAILLGLAVLVRPDSLVAVAVIGAHYVYVRRRFPTRPAIAFVALVTPFVVLAWATYGSPLPETLGAKQAQRESGLWDPFVVKWLERTGTYFFDSWNPSHLFGRELQFVAKGIFAVLVLAGLPALRVHRFWLLPLAWIVAVTLSYQVIDVPFYYWYGTAAIIGMAMLAGSGLTLALEAASRLARRTSVPRLLRAGVVASGAAAVVVLTAGLFDDAQSRISAGSDPRRPAYSDAARWLATNTPASATVGFHEIGYLGYESRRTIIDPLGLVTPASIPHVARRKVKWAYRWLRPDYLVQRPAFGKGRFRVNEPDIRRNYVFVKRVGDRQVQVSIYRRVEPQATSGV